MMKTSEKKKKSILYFLLVIAAVLLIILGLFFGSVKLAPSEIFAAISGKESSSTGSLILLAVRLPRVLGAVIAGAGLGTAGVILQGVLNNSLASPNTIGVNSGAGFFVMLSMIIMPQNLFAKSVMGFAGALVTSLLILALAMAAGKSRITIVLAGITISSFLSAGMSMIKILDAEINVNATHFLVGSLAGVNLDDLIYPAAGIVAGAVISMFLSKALNMLAFGDGISNSLGLHSSLYRFLFVLLASFMAGLVVSYAGLIGFVGLIVPHICRSVFGQDARDLLPASALLGAVLVLLADLLSRVMFAPYEIPVGILLSLIGGPFFLYLLIRKGGSRVNA